MFDSLRLELRRGCLIVAVLAQLRHEHYGYTLRKALADEGTLPATKVAEAIKKYGIDAAKPAPWTV